MKKIFIKLSVVLVAAIAIGMAWQYFFNNAKADVLSVEVLINNEHPWSQTFSWQNILPGETKAINFVIKNTGTEPVRIWKIIKNLTTEENGVNEPEQDWYNVNNGGQPKNDIDSAMTYEMYIDGQIAVEKEAGITLDKIKDYYIGLAKLDKAVDPSYTGPDPNGSGILNPGRTITVVEKYHFKGEAGNWAQSDRMTFDIEILAQEVSAAEPVKQISFLNNKFVAGDWHALADDKIGVLKYDSTALTFNYNFAGGGLATNKAYCLIYSKDPWGAPKILVDKGTSDANGEINLIGSKDTGDLPYADDGNYPTGAKIWLLPCGSGGYNESSQTVAWSPQDDWLFENWPGFINYTKGTAIETRTININELGGDIDNQYGYKFLGYPTANVTFTYNNPADDRLSGTIKATGLKPYATYQVKFEGKPVCQSGVSGNDLANEYIGYKGRWWDNTINSNTDDAGYAANSIYKGGTHCIIGYLVWDYITADANGNATKLAQTANSYHVLYSGGGVCNSNINSYLAYLDSAHPTVLFSPADKVNGQIERGACGGLVLSAGGYDVKMVLTEESFHQGNWATVLMGDINFTIN
jgi:hypothetical protein